MGSNATEFITGNIYIFGEEVKLHNDDDILKFLFESKGKESGELTSQCLEEIFCGFAAITKRMLEDHLKGGVLDTKDDELRQQSKSVQKSNVLSERDFRMLDHLMKMKSKATDMAMEGLIMFKSMFNAVASLTNKRDQSPPRAPSI